MAHPPLPAWADNASWALQQRIDSLSSQLTDAKDRLSDDDARSGAMSEHLRQLALQLRCCEARAAAQQAEFATEQHLQRIMQQNDVSRTCSGI